MNYPSSSSIQLKSIVTKSEEKISKEQSLVDINENQTSNENKETDEELPESNSFLTSENNQSKTESVKELRNSSTPVSGINIVLSTKSVQDVLIRETTDVPVSSPTAVKDLFDHPSSSQSTSHISNKNDTTVTNTVLSDNPPTNIENDQPLAVTNTKDIPTGSSIPRSQVRILSNNVDQPGSRRCSIGPPPSYSFVMKQKKKFTKQPPMPEVVTERPPPLPPAYTGDQDLYASRENEELNRVCILPSFAEPIWRSHSQPAYCPRCGILVLTTTHAHESVATHVAALALCLFGCWPCCILPYCMNVCKNTYHYCSVCQLYLGSYTPW